MAYFTPAELPENKYYIFGKGGGESLANELNTTVMAQIPLIQSIAESADKGESINTLKDEKTAKIYNQLGNQIIEKTK
jgi:ATP-binding protein involved in chromosome partitioning